MKYSHSSQHRKTCAHDPDYRAQLGYRLRAARCTLGWSIAEAAKYFQVTERTWHNWESGAHRIPFAVYKLCRVLARIELPGDSWAGWSFQGGALVTPEGRHIEAKDGAWWSLLVRNARSFVTAYNEATRLRLLVAQLQAGTGRDAAGSSTGCASAPESGAAAGLVSYKTNLKTDALQPLKPPIMTSDRRQDDVIMPSWPILYDYPTPSTPLHVPKPTTLESALTPSFVSPWTSTCGLQWSSPTRQADPASCVKPPPLRIPLKLTTRENPLPQMGEASPSPVPKSKPSTSKKKPNVNAYSVTSAMPAQAAKSAQQASASRGQA